MPRQSKKHALKLGGGSAQTKPDCDILHFHKKTNPQARLCFASLKLTCAYKAVKHPYTPDPMLNKRLTNDVWAMPSMDQEVADQAISHGVMAAGEGRVRSETENVLQLKAQPLNVLAAR